MSDFRFSEKFLRVHRTTLAEACHTYGSHFAMRLKKPLGWAVLDPNKATLVPTETEHYLHVFAPKVAGKLRPRPAAKIDHETALWWDNEYKDVGEEQFKLPNIIHTKEN